MALPLPPTYIGANAKDANPKATVAKCGRLVGSDSLAEHFPLISTRSRVGRRKRCRASSCAASSERQFEPVEPRRGAAEQIRLLGRTCRPGQYLAGVPECRVAIGALVDRKIALEHAAAGGGAFDAGLEIRPPGVRQGCGRERPRMPVKIEAADPHPEPAELHADVRAAGERPDGGGPAREHFLPLLRIAPDSERPPDMIEHDRRIGEFLRKRGELVDLRMIEPGIEGEAERREKRES